MNWSNRNWELEDRLFSPKRKIDNKNSRQKPHIIGSFFSFKMQRVIEFHSLAECLFYYLLEIDYNVIRYYIQPVNVEISYLSEEGAYEKWNHVPDVLVYRQGSKPYLYQIKHSQDQITKQFFLVNKYCERYAKNRDWFYKVIYPKQMPESVIYNIGFLAGYLKEGRGYSNWIPEIIFKLKHYKVSSIIDLSNLFRANVSPLVIKPIIFHLVAKGILEFNINETINSETEIWISNKSGFESLFKMEGELNETRSVED